MSVLFACRDKHSFLHRCERHLNIGALIFSVIVLFLVLVFSPSITRGSPVVNFTMTILPGSLSVAVLDTFYHVVPEPDVVFDATQYSTSCQTVDSYLFTSEERMYVQNMNAADDGWTVTIAAQNPSDLWESGSKKIDFNDLSDSGCTDGPDSDTFAGSLEINPEVGLLSSGLCSSCSIDFVTRGVASRFDQENSVNVITLLSAAPNSHDQGDWFLSDILVRQTLPARQPSSGDYELNLSLSITAN